MYKIYYFPFEDWINRYNSVRVSDSKLWYLQFWDLTLLFHLFLDTVRYVLELAMELDQWKPFHLRTFWNFGTFKDKICFTSPMSFKPHSSQCILETLDIEMFPKHLSTSLQDKWVEDIIYFSLLVMKIFFSIDIYIYIYIYIIPQAAHNYLNKVFFYWSEVSLWNEESFPTYTQPPVSSFTSFFKIESKIGSDILPFHKRCFNGIFSRWTLS